MRRRELRILYTVKFTGINSYTLFSIGNMVSR